MSDIKNENIVTYRLNKSTVIRFSGPRSSKSGNGLISVEWSIGAILVVNSFPLIVIVMLNIDCTMDDWLPHVNEKEERDQWECKSCPVSREPNV